jgi:predicted nucleic acid-binding protein
VPRFLPDTNCIVAALLEPHPHHERAASEIKRRLARGETPVMAAPALVEAYSVLTRSPPPLRLSPERAWRLIEGSFLDSATDIVALDAPAYRRILSSAPQQGTAGGRIYDAIIVACARAAQVDTILTFNERQFVPLAAGAIEIIVPSV